MKIWPILRLLSVYIIIAHSNNLVDSTDNGTTSDDTSESSNSQSQDEGTPSSEPAQGSGLSSQEQSGSNGLGGSDGLTQSSNQQHSDQDKSGTTPVTQPTDPSTQASSETDDGVSQDVSVTPDGSDADTSPKQISNLVDVDISKIENTEYYEYKDSIYTAKGSYKFKRIVKGSHEIRVFEDSKCPVKIDVFFDEPNILLSIYDGKSSNFSCFVVNDPDTNLTPKLPDDSQSQDGGATPSDSSSTPKSEPDGSTPIYDGSGQQTPSAVSESNSPVPEDTTPSGDGSQSKHESDGSTVTITASVITGSEVFAEHLKFLTLSDQGLSTEDKSKLDIQILTDLSSCTFKKGSKCTELNYDNQTVWKHDTQVHGDKYPNNVLLNTTTKFIVLECTGVYQYFFSYYNNQWNPIFSYTSGPSKVNQAKVDLNKLKFMKEGEDKIEEMDQTKFDKSEEGTIVKFKFKTGSRCLEITYDSHTVWKYESSVHANKYPTIVIVNTNNNLLTVDSSGNYRHFYSYFDNKFKQTFAYRTGSKKLDPTKLMLITQETVGTTKENDQTKFDKSEKGPVHEYKFKDDSKCVEVKYEQSTVWKHDDSVHGTNYPTSLTLNSSRNVVMVKSSDHYTQMYTYYEDKWSTGPSHGIRSHFKLDKLKVVTLEADGTKKENDTTKFEKSEVGSFVSYTFKDDSKCTNVKYEDDVVWQHDLERHGQSYPTGLTLNLNTNFMLLESKKQYQHFYSYFDGRWNSTFSYKSHGISGDLDKSKLKVFTVDHDGTSSVNDFTKYEMKESAKVYTYTFKPEAVCFRVNYEDILVWEYNEDKHGDHYPTSLVFNMTNELIMVESKNEYLHFYSFYRSEWRPVMGAVSHVPAPVPQPTAKYSMPLQLESPKVKLMFTDSAGNVKENDTSMFYLSEKYHLLTYNFHCEAKCSEVLYDDVSVWKVSDFSGTNSPKQLVMNKTANTLHVDCNDKFFLYQLLDSKWNLVSTFDPNSPRTPESQDKSDKTKLELLGEKSDGTTASLDDSAYDSSEDSELKLLTYKFKDDVKCTEAKYKNSTAWKHDHPVSGGKHPKAVYLHIDVERVVVEFEGFYLRYEFKDDKCNFVLLADTGHFDESKFKLYTMHNNDYSKCYLDANKYEVLKYYNEVQYRLKSDAKCLRVRYRGKLVWNHDKGDFNEHHPKTVTYNLDTRRAIVHFDNNWHYCYQHTFVDWKQVGSLETGKPSDIPQKDPNYKPEEVEEFQHPPSTESHEQLKTQLTDGGTHTTPDSDGSQTGGKTQTKSDGSKTPQPKPETDVAQPTAGQDQQPKVEPSTPSTQSSAGPKLQSAGKAEPPKPTQSSSTTDSKSGSSSKTPVELDVQGVESTDKFDCVVDANNKTRTYTSKESYLFKKIYQKNSSGGSSSSDLIIYETTNDSEYAYKVEMFDPDSDTKKLTIYLVNDTTKCFSKEKDGFFSKKPWKECVSKTDEQPKIDGTDSEGKSRIILDIEKHKKSNDMYDYKEENTKKTYNVKDGYVFLTVTEGIRQLWTCTDGLHGLKVEVEELDNGKIGITVERRGSNKIFGEVDRRSPTHGGYDTDKSQVKLFAANDSQLVENTHFEVKVDYDSSTKYDLMPNSNCVKVQYGTETIWEHNSSHNGQYPINVYFLANGKLKVAVNSQFEEKDVTHLLELRYEDEEDDLSIDLIKLDIDKTESTNHIEYSKDNNVETYTAKGTFLIKTVKRGSTVIWRSHNDTYPNKLTVTQVGNGKYKIELSYGSVTKPSKQSKETSE